MPREWTGKWKGGRYYLDAEGREVFVIESDREGIPRSITLKVHDKDLAVGQLATFLEDPAKFVRSLEPVVTQVNDPVFITKDRLTLYMEHIRKAVLDHRNARRSYLHAWSEKKLDLRTVTRRDLRVALASFTGGHRGRVEALNAFARFLVKEGDLPSWNPLVNTREPKQTRAEQVAYSPEELLAKYKVLSQAFRDVMVVRLTAAGMHHTEIEQIKGCKVYDSGQLLPDKGVGIRILDGSHQIKGVLQFKQKTKPRHRVSVGEHTLQAILRLRDDVPNRMAVWYAFDPLIPSNLRHTWVTLSRQKGAAIVSEEEGVSLDVIQELMGHRIGSKVTLSSYDKLQVPPMIVLPLEWDVL